MNSSTKTYEKFNFGRSFEEGGEKKYKSQFRRSFSQSEVEELNAQAYEAGLQDALAQAESEKARAIFALSETVAQGLAALSQAVFDHKAQAVALCAHIAQKLAAGALEQAPLVPMKEALARLEHDIEKSPKLILAAPQWSDELKAAAMEAVSMAGYEGNVLFRTQSGKPSGSFELFWNEGRAVFDPAFMAQEMMQAIHQSLESEAYHSQHQDSLPPQAGLMNEDE